LRGDNDCGVVGCPETPTIATCNDIPNEVFKTYY